MSRSEHLLQLTASILIALPCFAADLSPEAQIALTSLRTGERARVEAVLGDAGQLPLYRGEFLVDPDARLVTGKVSLTITVKTAELFLRCTPNANHPGAVILSKAKVNGVPVGLAQPDPSLYRLKLDAEKGQQVTVEVELKARVPRLRKDAGGLTTLQVDGPVGDYGAFGASDDVVSLVGLMPMIPPERGGKLFEGPSGLGDLGSFDPSNFIVSVSTPSAWRAVSSGQAVGEVPTGDGAVRYAYTIAAARELPLLLLKGAKVTTKQVGEVTVEAVLLPGGDPKQAAQVTEHVGKALELLEAKLGPYPFKTLRVVEMRLVNGAGGMEFAGLITLSAGLLSGQTDPLEALGLGGDQAAMVLAMLGPALGQLMKNTLEFTIDHELAHQYTALLVGSDPIAEPVADEALTQHLALLLLEWRQGKAAADQMREGQLKAAYHLHRLLGGLDGKANRATHEYQSNREYAALIYGKAPLLFDEQRKLVGDEAWLKALRTYVEANRYRWVTGRTLTELVSKQNPGSTKKLEALRQRWWNESHGDEDLGLLDLDAMLTGGIKGIDPKLVKEMEKMMQQLSGE